MSDYERKARRLVTRAFAAAAGGTARLGAGKTLADAALLAWRQAVEAPRVSRYAEANVAAEARRNFTAWVSSAGLGVDDQKAADAVQAATSAAGCLARGLLSEADRLARNALRFATEATGGEADWTVEGG